MGSDISSAIRAHQDRIDAALGALVTTECNAATSPLDLEMRLCAIADSCARHAGCTVGTMVALGMIQESCAERHAAELGAALHQASRLRKPCYSFDWRAFAAAVTNGKT